MKRIGFLYDKICSIENIKLADEKARKGKLKQYGVRQHDKNREANIQSLHEMLVNQTYKTSPYKTFSVFEPKERLVFKLPYWPDRIGQWGVMNILEPIFVSCYTNDTYSCIKGRGIHAAVNNIKKALKDESGTKYCLKLDITKFYPSVDHDVLKHQLRRKFKDQKLLSLLDEIISSAPGLPIGSITSQYLSNFYLTTFDKWVKQELKAKYYFRYADDIVILSDSKEFLHSSLKAIEIYLSDNLKLKVKSNWQVFPVESRGIDFVGYVFRHPYTRIRKRIKQRFAKMLVYNPNEKSVASYHGLLLHADTKHLRKKLLNHEIIQRLERKTKRKHFLQRR